jgi:hypothetical protein
MKGRNSNENFESGSWTWWRKEDCGEGRGGARWRAAEEKEEEEKEDEEEGGGGRAAAAGWWWWGAV